MRLRLVCAVGVLVTLAACSPPPTSGTVEHRQYSAPYSYVTTPCTLWATRTYTTTVYSGGRSQTVTRSSSYCAAHTVHYNHMPATYGLCLRHDKPGEHDGCFDTDPATYGRYPEGSHYP